MFARTVQRLGRRRVAVRKYANVGPINLHEKLGMGADGIPETIVIPGIAGEYASKFFRDAYQRGGQKIAMGFEAELNILTWSVRGDSDWGILTTSPFFPVEEKEATVRKKCKELKLTQFFANRIVKLLNDSNDIARLEQLRTDYEEIMRFIRKERQVTLITGTDLSPQEIEMLKESIKNDYLRPDDIIVFSHQVDPSILGGMKVVVETSESNYAWNKGSVDDVALRFREGARRQFGVPEKALQQAALPTADTSKMLNPLIYSKETIDKMAAIAKSAREGKEHSIGFLWNKPVEQHH